MSGVLQGGWEYVQAAYLITAAILIGYAVSIHARYRGEKSRRGREHEGAVNDDGAGDR